MEGYVTLIIASVVIFVIVLLLILFACLLEARKKYDVTTSNLILTSTAVRLNFKYMYDIL